MDPIKLLIVDDEEDIREILQFNLENEGYLIDTASSGEEALEILTSEHSLILLDVMMGGMSGFQVAQKLRKSNNLIPIIFLTAKSAENDLLTGFSVGADDYIPKPFSIKEVIVRVKAVMKRRPVERPEVAKEEKTVFTCGGLSLRIPAKQLVIDGQEAILTKKEFDLLHLLMLHPKHVYTREDIIRELWQDESFVLERTVDVHISRLRKKLGEYSSYITNRSGYGYSFSEPLINHENKV
jgi:DNA-binding response OmpR family regulator